MSIQGCLKYGQIVSISPLENQDMCIYSDGLIKVTAALVEITADTLASGALFYQSLFRIYPGFVTSRLHQALHLMMDKKSEDSSKRMQKIKELQQKIIVEYKMNIESSQKVKDSSLSFNQSIQFIHLATNKFLSCSFAEAKQERENFKLELVDYPSQASSFKLQPAFAHQFQQEALIYPGDSVYIQCEHIYLGIRPKLRATLKTKEMNNAKYLSDRTIFAVPNLRLLKRMTDQMHQQNGIVDASETIQKFQKAAKTIKSSGMKRQSTYKVDEVKANGVWSEVNVSLERKSAWVLNVFANQNDFEQIISYNDIIWIHHIEENALVSIARNQDDELIITFLKNKKDSNEEFQGNSNGMFQVEAEVMTNGGLLEWGQNLRLRHFILGKYLAINLEAIIDKTGQQLLYLTDTPQANTLFQFIPVPTMGQNQLSQKYVTKDAFMKLKTAGKKNLWIHIEEKKILQTNNKLKNVVTEEDKCVLVVRLTDNTEDDDVLKLYKANYSDVIEGNFLVTCFPVLRKSLQVLTQVKNQNDEACKLQINKTLNKLTLTIGKIDRFCNNILLNTQLDSKNLKVAILKRQKILREQYFIDLLIRVMKVITNEEELKQYHEYTMLMHQQSLVAKESSTRSGINSKQGTIHHSPSKKEKTINESSTPGKQKIQVSTTIHASHRLRNQKYKQQMAFLTEKMNVLKLIYRLLKSICEDNPENQSYVYKLFPHFIYQIKYFREATDCIIAVLQGNEQILVNLCDQIKLNEKIKPNDRIDQSDSGSIQSQEAEIHFNSEVDEKTNILLYYKRLTEDSQGEHNIQYLEFFRSICRLNESSISVNQEMVFKFMKQNDIFKSSLFMPIIIEATKMKIIVGPSQIFYLTSIKDPLVSQYLITQLFLYADLAFQRNFLWKSYLQQIFPTQFVFDQIFETSMSIEYRSAFCNLALSVYVDHEPFNQALVPNLCRLFTDAKPLKISVQSHLKVRQLAASFASLIETTFKYLDQICAEIDADLDKKYKTKLRAQLVDDQPVTNQLILDIVRLISIMIRYDMLKLLNQEERYKVIVPKIIKLLEYDRHSLLFPYILSTVRANNITKAKENQEKLNVIKGVGSSAVNAIASIAKALTTSILGLPQKQQESLEDEFSEYDTAVIARNPVISSLISITSTLDSFVMDETSSKGNNQKAKVYDQDIQKEVCGILLYFQDQRQDFYVSNFLQFFRDRIQKYPNPNFDDSVFEAKYYKDLDTDMVLVLPPLLRTGVEEIDNEGRSQLSALSNSGDMNELMGMGMGNLLNQQRKFTKLSNDIQEVPDLDKLMAGEYANIMEGQLLPSVLISFYTTTDFELQNLLIEVMRRCFSQTEELFDHLQKVELLFNKDEISCYQFLEASIQELKILTECSEVWLVDFLAEPNGQTKEIVKILKLLSDIRLLLEDGTSIDHKGRVIQSQHSVISPSRQKIFNFLNAYLPMVNFIRDTQQQFVKVLDDVYYSNETKIISLQLLHALFQCLTDFCFQNSENQLILHKNVSLFLDELEHDYGQMTLISAIYKDNKQLCQRVSDSLLDQVLRFIYQFGRQARFLLFFQAIQTFKSNPITEIQSKVLNLFIPTHIGTEEYIDIHEFNLFGEFVVESGRKVIQFHFQPANLKQLKDQPYLYHSEILQVLLTTIVGDESFKVNAPKLKKLFKLHYLLQLLLLEDDMLSNEEPEASNCNLSIMKPQLIQMINIIYVNNKVTDLFLFIKEQNTFTQLFSIEKNKLVKVQLMPNSQNRYLGYFFDYIIVLMRCYSEKVIVKDGNQEYKERDDYLQLRDIMNIIKQMATSILQNRLKALQYNNLIKFVCSIDEQLFRDNSGQFSQCLEQQEPKPKDAQDDQQTIFTQKKQSSPLLDKSVKPQKLHRTDKKFALDLQQPYEWETTASWNKFLQACQLQNRSQRQQEIEKRLLAESILNAHKFIPEAIIKELSLTIQFKDYLRKFIRFVEIGIINQADQNNLIFSLQILEDILDSAEDLYDMQIKFDSCQATRMVLNLLGDFQTHPFDEQLLIQLFKFALKLSKQGNDVIQKTIYNYFSNFEKSELIFLKMYQIIYEVINDNKVRQKNLELKQQQKEKAQYSQQLYLQGVQEQTEDDPLALKEANESRNTKISILIYLLKFLQQICEGHNLEIQNYLRFQINSRNNYNIVQAMVELLFAFESNLQKDTFDLVINTLETLTELVQGPCSQNQQDIIDSTFLDVASNYLNMEILSRKKSKKQKGNAADNGSNSDERSFKERSNSIGSKSTNRAGKQNKTPSIDRWMLERLKFKCMVLVYSLLELNSDKLAIKRILRSLPISVLRKNLIVIYRKHEKMYKAIGYNKESLNHIVADPSDPKLPSEYHEMIIETGFFVYFLINYYSELDIKEIDPETRDDLEQIKEFQKDSEKKDPWAELQNTLIGQIMSLVYSLISGILELINDWRAEIQKQVFRGKADAQDEEKRKEEKKKQQALAFSQAINFFAKNSATIEVVRNGELEKIIFYKHSFCNYLPKETKIEFHERVDRDSTNSKISELVDSSASLIEVCKHEEDLAQFFNRNKFVSIFAKYVILWKDLAFLLTLLLNILIILSFYEGEQADESERYQSRLFEPTLLKILGSTETQAIFMYCGLVMIVCSTFVVLFFVLKKGLLYVKEAWSQSQDLIHKDQSWIVRFVLKFYMVGFCLVKVLLNIDMIYYLTYGVLAFIATLVHPFFFAFHLSEVVLRYPTLRNIIRSFWEPKAALGLTFILVLLMNYYFTLIAYIWFADLYQYGRCDSLLVCFMATFDYAFKNNGGIGGWFDGSVPQDPNHFDIARFFFDNLNNIFIQMISIQIFSGIIIDTFGELREQSLAKEEDKQNICFICGMDREIFDRKSDDGFLVHTKHEHYMWNYAFYIAYLYNKSKGEYNGIETYINNKAKNLDNSWFPINQSMKMAEELDKHEDEDDQKYTQIQAKMAKIKQLSKNICSMLEECETNKQK